jgi:hypothetical protein
MPHSEHTMMNRWSDGFMRLFQFFKDHRSCPDPHLITKSRRVEDGWRLEAMCPACGGLAVVEISEGEAEVLDSMPAAQSLRIQ